MVGLVDFIEFLKYIIPSLVVALVTMFFLKKFFAEEEARRYYKLRMATTKSTIPVRFQAYERLAILLERISIVPLIHRSPKNIKSIDVYRAMLIQQIKQEYEHNLSQQVYVTPELWNMIVTAKNATIMLINSAHQRMGEKSTVHNYIDLLLTNVSDEESPIKLALIKLKKEIAQEF